MGAINRVATDSPLNLRGVHWWRVWRLEKPTTVSVDGEEFSVNAGDALQAGPGRTFRRIRFEGAALVEHSNDPEEAFPGAVPNADGAVLLYSAENRVGVPGGESDVFDSGLLDVRMFRALLIDARFVSPGDFSALSLLTQDSADPTADYIVTQVASGPELAASASASHRLIAWPSYAATPDPYDDGDGEGFLVVPIGTPLPGWVGVRMTLGEGATGTLRVWGRR